jgi:hypothetical protein
MAEAHHIWPDLSQVEFLLEQQRYQEALVPLAQLIEENPCNLQIRLYRLLAARLLILNQMLGDGTNPVVRTDRLRVREVFSKWAALRTRMNFFSIRSFRSLSQPSEASPTGLIRRVALALGLAGLFVTPVSFCLDVSDQPTDRTNRQSFHVADGFAGINRKEVEWSYEESPYPIATQVRSVGALNSDDVRLRIGPIPAHAALTSHRKPAVSDVASVPEIKVRRKEFRSPARELQMVYRTKSSLSLRQEPRFASASVRQIAEGTHINVLGVSGNWLRVRPEHSSAIGYLRKEFLVAANTAPSALPEPAFAGSPELQ